MVDIEAANWRLGSVVALIQWIPELTRDTMPQILREALLAHTTLDVTRDYAVHQQRGTRVSELRYLSVTQAAELAQWSDLGVFDYLTGNYDRVASMQVSFFVEVFMLKQLDF